MVRNGTRVGLIVALFALLPFVSSSESRQLSRSNAQTEIGEKPGIVFVCACLRTKSCSCMTEAKMEGPCACGTQGGPPLKAVSSDSAWAKANREELAK